MEIHQKNNTTVTEQSTSSGNEQNSKKAVERYKQNHKVTDSHKSTEQFEASSHHRSFEKQQIKKSSGQPLLFSQREPDLRYPANRLTGPHSRQNINQSAGVSEQSGLPSVNTDKSRAQESLRPSRGSSSSRQMELAASQSAKREQFQKLGTTNNSRILSMYEQIIIDKAEKEIHEKAPQCLKPQLVQTVQQLQKRFEQQQANFQVKAPISSNNQTTNMFKTPQIKRQTDVQFLKANPNANMKGARSTFFGQPASQSINAITRNTLMPFSKDFENGLRAM